jgi:hypothetical protein
VHYDDHTGFEVIKFVDIDAIIDVVLLDIVVDIVKDVESSVEKDRL